MNYSIDEIYDLLTWDQQLSIEENEIKEQKGIEAAGQIKNLFPFMQPTILPAEKSKLVWEPCAKIIANRSDQELEPYLFMLLDWIYDLNWPGAMIIYDRLKVMPFSRIEYAYKYTRTKAEQNGDSIWLYSLDILYKEIMSSAGL